MPAASHKLVRRSNVWWTRGRVIAGLRRFYDDFGCAPTSSGAYQQKQQFTGQLRNGRPSNQGSDSKYPSTYAVLRHFPRFRAAWTAAGIDVDRGWEPWTAEELWYVREATGILPRTQIARDLNRTPHAVHRRQYDMGLYAPTAWGWTPTRVESAIGVSWTVIMRYVEHGRMPFFRGSKYIYLDPADLLMIEEFDWSRERKIPRDLRDAIRKSLMRRLCLTLQGHDWRKLSIYKLATERPAVEPRDRKYPPPFERPKELKAGDWAQVCATDDRLRRRDLIGRKGEIKAIFWTQLRRKEQDGTASRDACWAARVEFKKMKRHGRDETLVSYVVPLPSLKRVRAPQGARTQAEATKSGSARGEAVARRARRPAVGGRRPAPTKAATSASRRGSSTPGRRGAGREGAGRPANNRRGGVR